MKIPVLRKTMQKVGTLFPSIFSICAIVISIIALYRDCNQDKKIEEFNYMTIALSIKIPN
jgi:uncharacterized membrane protein